MSRIVKNPKGLSPIFAALIMLGIVTILFIPIFIWSTGLTAGTQSFWERSGMIATERIVIEEVSLKAGSTNCTIYVRNIGKTDISVSNVFIVKGEVGPTYSFDKSVFTTRDPVTNAQINSVIQGDLIKVYIGTLGFSPTVDTTYTVKVFTERGVGDNYQIKA